MRTNQRVDENGTSIVRRAMIQVGLSKDLGGIWRDESLRNKLQQIILDHPENFGGQIPLPPKI